MSKQKKVAVLGAGSWGTSLAHHLQRAGHETMLWGRDQNVIRSISQEKKNPRYLNSYTLANGLAADIDLAKTLDGAELVVVAIPSSSVRTVIRQTAKLFGSKSPLILSGVKGLEKESLKTCTQVIADELGSDERLAALGGPSFAAELVQGLPTAVTVASKKAETAEEIRRYLHFDNLRVYTSNDVVGVELGGAIKNVIAVASGLVDGVGMGQNARAALITRGIVELSALAEAMGADARTIGGLAGLGDLLLTAVGDLSRNRQVGLRLGRGEKLEQITNDLGQVAEGVKSTRLVRVLAEKHGVDMPIVRETDEVISGRKSVVEAVGTLLAREPKQEV